MMSLFCHVTDFMCLDGTAPSDQAGSRWDLDLQAATLTLMFMLVTLHPGRSRQAARNGLRLSVLSPHPPKLREGQVAEEEEECHLVLHLPEGGAERDSSSGPGSCDGSGNSSCSIVFPC